MIDFACKKFDIEEVVKCVLSLSKSDYKILKFLMNVHGNLTTEELSIKLKLDKSTIQRGVKSLHGRKLLFRTQKNKNSGGYVFLYRVSEKDKIRKMITDVMDNWISVFNEKIKEW